MTHIWCSPPNAANRHPIQLIVASNSDAVEDDRRLFCQRSLQTAGKNHLELGVDQVEHVQALAAVADSKEPRRAAHCMNELAALGEQQTRGHGLLEQCVVNREQLSEGM